MNKCLDKFVPTKYLEDFKHDLFENLIKYSDRVLDAYQYDIVKLSSLKFYVARCIISMATQKRNMLQSNYIKKETIELKDIHISEPCEDSFPFEFRQIKEDNEDIIIDRLKDSESKLCTPYYRLLGEALMINGTAGKVSKATGIPKSSVQQGIKKIREYLSNE